MDSINSACKFGSDAWLELQAFKTRQLNRREKLNRHKNLHKDLINGIVLNHQQLPHTSGQLASSQPASHRPTSPNLPGTSKLRSAPDHTHHCSLDPISHEKSLETYSKHATNSLSQPEAEGTILNHECSSKYGDCVAGKSLDDSTSNSATDYISASSDPIESPLSINLDLVECLLLLKLCDVALKLPIDSKSLRKSINKIRGFEATPLSLVENLLQKFAHQELITIDELTTSLTNRKHQVKGSNEDGFDETCIYVTSADHTKLVELDKSIGSLDGIRALLLESKNEEGCDEFIASNSQHTSVPIQSMRNSSSYSKPQRDESKMTESREVILKQSSELSSHDKLNHIPNTINKLQTSTALHGSGVRTNYNSDDLESLLLLSSTKERESKKLGEELLELLSKPTAKERNLLERFRSADGYQVQEFCPKGTKGECRRNNNGVGSCTKLHFKKIIAKHTEESLGDCSFLNTCFHMDSCKYVHYEVDYDDKQPKHQFKRPHCNDFNVKQREIREVDKPTRASPISSDVITGTNVRTSLNDNIDSIDNKLPITNVSLSILPGSVAKYTLSPEEQAQIDAKNRKRFKTVLYPPQWIQCDLRFFDMSLLGKFSVVMADPPWDIHMELPYGTMSDDEMRKLNIPGLQDEGVIFLWVTGRAMELGRECLSLWGYERCDEIIWVKTNQLQRIIRTGRTGHWLNHGKEHCLVGVKGNPKDINRGLDCDVIVAEVRATSHKPDEIYGIIERLSPGTRKIELFGRAHNVQPNWITLGNQLNGVRLIEPNLVSAFKKLNLPYQTSEHLA